MARTGSQGWLRGAAAGSWGQTAEDLEAFQQPLEFLPSSVCMCEGCWEGPISGDGKSCELLMVFVAVSSANDDNHVHCNNECNENFGKELIDQLRL